MTLGEEENSSDAIETTEMDDDQSSDNVGEPGTATRYFLHKVGGFDLLKTRPVLVEKTETLFVISGNNLRKYSLKDGSFYDEYNFGNKVPIVAVQENDDNEEELIVAIEDGTIIVWNHVENVRRSQSFIQVKKDLGYFRAVKDHYYFIHNSRMVACPKNQLNKIVLISGFNIMSKNLNVNEVAFGPKENIQYMAAIHGNDVGVYEIPPRYGSRHFHHLSMQGTKLTCIDFHPTQPTVVTGDSVGRVIVWSNINTKEKIVRTILPWHTRAVADIAFSPSGTYVYSVGKEAVLVQWNMVGEHFGKQNFLPRLGTPIKWLAVDKSHNQLVTSHEDQCLQIIDTQMNGIRTVIEGLSIGSGHEGRLTGGLQFNQKLQALTLNGRVGHVQVYNPVRQKQLFQLDVTEQNVVSEVVIGSLEERVRNEKALIKKIFPIEVTKLAVSSCGQWMATVEYRNDHETLPEIRLKFWYLLEKNNKFFLNTTIHLPHQEEIIFINFSKTDKEGLNLVSGGKDKFFKIWDLLVNDNGTNYWNCSRSISFNPYAEPRMAVFSHDRSLVSVLFDANTVTLWELGSSNIIRYVPRLNVFKNTAFKQKKKIIFIGFGGEKTAHLFIEVVDRIVSVSNIINKFESVFTFKTEHPIVSVTQSIYENVLALRSRFGIEFLSLDTRTLLGKVDLTIHLNFQGEIISSIFLPTYLRGKNKEKRNSTQMLKNSIFYLINSKCQIYEAILGTDGCELFSDDNSIIVVGSDTKTEIFVRQVNQTALNIILKKTNESSKEEEGELMLQLNAGAATNIDRKMLIDKFFNDVPSHVLPPLTMFGKSFIKAYAACLEGEKRRTTSEFTQDSQKEENEDEFKRPTLKIALQSDGPRKENIETLKVRNILDTLEEVVDDEINIEQVPQQINDIRDHFYWLPKLFKKMSTETTAETTS